MIVDVVQSELVYNQDSIEQSLTHFTQGSDWSNLSRHFLPGGEFS
jgi:hypothetical protein